jgi:hypothetical protein
MAGSHARQGGAAHDLDDERPSHAATHADLDAATPIVGAADPRLAHGSSAPGLMALQRSAGNAAVAGLVAPRSVQRAVQIDELTSRVDVADGPAGVGAATGAAANAAASPVSSDGATTTITGSTISLDAAMTQTDGIIRADTIIAENVIGSNYTPGAGNLQ